MPVEVRVPRPDEFEALANLWERFMNEQNEQFVNRIWVNDHNRNRFLQFVNEKLSTGNALVVVLPPEEGGEIIGYSVFDPVPFVMELKYQEASILDIYIVPEHRGKGYGRQLMEAAVRNIKAAGFHHVRLQVYASNAEAIEFYEHLGFRRYIDIMKLEL